MNNPRNDKYRHQILRVIVYAVFAFFALTAGYLQLIEGNSYIDKAENNYIRYIITYPPRGEVFDRNGEYLIQNKVVYDLMVVPREAPRKGIDTMRLASITNEPIKRLKRSLNESRRSWRTASPVVKYLSAESKLKMDEWNLPGFYTVPRTVRQYPRKIGGNLLGSLSEVSQNFLAKYNEDGYYSSRDYIGEQGIESAYEKELRGEKGRIRRNLYADHSTTDEVEKEPVAGKNLISSIDARLQAFAEELMKDKIGSVVAIETGIGSPTVNTVFGTARVAFLPFFEKVRVRPRLALKLRVCSPALETGTLTSNFVFAELAAVVNNALIPLSAVQLDVTPFMLIVDVNAG